MKTVLIALFALGLFAGAPVSANETERGHGDKHEEEHEEASPPVHGEEGHNHCVDHGVVVC